MIYQKRKGCVSLLFQLAPPPPPPPPPPAPHAPAPPPPADDAKLLANAEEKPALNADAEKEDELLVNELPALV